jgi:hypothetical protein
MRYDGYTGYTSYTQRGIMIASIIAGIAGGIALSDLVYQWLTQRIEK